MILCLSIGTLAYKSINISEQNKEILKEVHSSSQEVLELQNNKITPLYKLRELTQSLVMAPNKTLRIDIENNRTLNSAGITFRHYLKIFYFGS